MRAKSVRSFVVALVFMLALAAFSEWQIPYDLPERIDLGVAPAPKSAPQVVQTCRIVDHGDDFAWRSGFPYLTDKQNLQEKTGLDLDGDGNSNDSIGYYPFSLETPLNQLPGVYMIHNANNAIFYGGGVGFFYNKKPKLSENCLNVDYLGCFEDISFNAYATEKDTALRVFGVYLWKKDDFLNGGDEFPVRFDETSMMAVRITRAWSGYNEGRFVVRQDGQFWISEYDFNIKNPDNRKSNGMKIHRIAPAAMKWAKWNPEGPYHIGYSPEELVFEEVDFTNVDTVGWMIAKTDISPASCWLKWGGFECRASVERPWRPSEHLNMAEAGSKTWISEQPVSFKQWRKIYNWGAREMWITTPNYVFDQNGDMGTMDYGGKHSADEYVSDITWLDALNWCNALSVFEGRRPCYYTDPEKTQPLRAVKKRQEWDQQDWEPAVYVDVEADGYRLPVPSELGAAPSSKEPVWEWVWDCGDQWDPSTGRHTVYSTASGIKAPSASPLPFGEEPYTGSPMIGFRAVRSDSGATAKGTAPSAKWTIVKGERMPGSDLQKALSAPEMAALPGGEFNYAKGGSIKAVALPFELQKTEVTFGLWNTVRNRAEADGYVFNHDGDMGSMMLMHGNPVFTPDMPVAGINVFDAMLFCNALSEMTGRTPMYYSDEAKTAVLKTANPFRNDMADVGGSTNAPEISVTHRFAKEFIDPRFVSKMAYVKWEADGFRLPTEAEWEFAARRAGDIRKYPEGNEAWVWDNSGGKTMPVGTSDPSADGLFDLFGNVYEYTWGGEQDPFDTLNPRNEAFDPSIKGGSFYLMNTPRDARELQAEVRHDGAKKSVVAYPELGFRVSRCEAGVQPRVKGQGEEIVLDINPDTIDPLPETMYRSGNRRTGQFSRSGVPALTGTKWTFDTGAKVDASPVVVNGILYIGDMSGVFYALDADTGAVKWKKKISDHPLRSSAAVHVPSETVLFDGCDGSLYALDAKTGAEKWTARSDSGSGHEKEYGHGTSPMVLGDYVFSNGPKYLCGYDVRTGKLVWEYLEGQNARGLSAITQAGALLTYGNGSAKVDVVSLLTARPREPLHINGGDTYQSTAAYDGELVYSAEGKGIGAYRLKTEANPEKRLADVIFQYKEPHWDKYHPHFSAVGLDDRHVYAGNIDTHLYAVDKQTGKLAWKFKTGDAVYSAPSIAKGTVYFGSMDGSLYAVDAQTGKEKWTFKTGGPIVWSSPWIGDGVVYIGSRDGKIYAIK